jgi:hypothetical protein
MYQKCSDHPAGTNPVSFSKVVLTLYTYPGFIHGLDKEVAGMGGAAVIKGLLLAFCYRWMPQKQF